MRKMCNEYELNEIDQFLDDLTNVSSDENIQLDFLNTLDDLLNPGQYLKR